jgi:hypothetical protein
MSGSGGAAAGPPGKGHGLAEEDQAERDEPDSHKRALQGERARWLKLANVRAESQDRAELNQIAVDASSSSNIAC